MNKDNRFHEKLHPLDTPDQTFGCRHTNSNICGKKNIPDICAFVRSDGICTSPPKTWPKQFSKLLDCIDVDSL